MLRVELTGPDGATQILPFSQLDLTVGRGDENQLVLPHATVSPRHARIVVRIDKVIVVDLQSDNGTWVNGRRLSSPLVLRAHDKVVIGRYVLRLWVNEPEDDEPTLELDVTEQRLLASVVAREPGSREVYADWLEERGEAPRAEYLRLQDALAALPPETEHEVKQRVAALAPTLERRWRLKVARGVIEGCAGQPACPRDWGGLAPTRTPDVRACVGCGRLVYFCRDAVDARVQLALDARVVIDPGAPRAPGDLPGWNDEPDPEREFAASPTVEIQVPSGS